jgi:Leucine-rich repeat (LRR) protein
LASLAASQSDWPLPHSLQVLNISGCTLSSLPQSLVRLTALQQLHAGANRCANMGDDAQRAKPGAAAPLQPLVPNNSGRRLRSIDIVFQLPSLLHAGLSFNPISSLPAQAMQSSTKLMSIDLAQCDLSSLEPTLAALRCLPKLQVSVARCQWCCLPSIDCEPPLLQ